MSIDELMKVIKAEGLEMPDLYYDGNHQIDAVVLERKGDSWEVYISDERSTAIASTLKTFTSESAALDYVLLKLRQSKKYNDSMSTLRQRRSHLAAEE